MPARRPLVKTAPAGQFVIMRTLAIVLLCIAIAGGVLSVVGHIGLAAGWWH